MPSALGPHETVVTVDGHAVLAAAPLFVYVRRGELTYRALDALAARIPPLRARYGTPGRHVGFVAVLEDGAPVPPREMLSRQRSLLDNMVKGVDARLVGVILGDGVPALLQRGLMRAVLIANPLVRITGALADAASWCAPHIGVDEGEVLHVIERARALAAHA